MRKRRTKRVDGEEEVRTRWRKVEEEKECGLSKER